MSKTEMKHRLLLGQKFGKLTVVDIIRNFKTNEWVAKCICECGKTSLPRPSKLTSKATVSCGCYRNGLMRRKLFSIRNSFL